MKQFLKKVFLKQKSSKNGISIVIVTYKRNHSLRILLRSILRQKLPLPTEIILLNNDPETQIQIPQFLAFFVKIFYKIKHIKIVNFSQNYGCQIRFAFATMAKYDTILFLDDDIKLLDKNFVSHMHAELENFGEKDIISCWCARFKSNKNYYETDGFSFETNIKQPVELDLVGPGISMFKKTLLTPELISIPPRYQPVDNVWFSLMSTILEDSKKYFVPCYKMLEFVQNDVNPMYAQEGVAEMKSIAIKELVKKGYQSVIEK